MANLIRTAHYFKVTIPDKSGTLAHMLGSLHDAGVNLLAVHAFPRNRRTQVDVVPEDPTTFKDVVKPLKWKVRGPNVCFLVDGDDRPGALVTLTDQLASAKINLTAVTATAAGQGRFGAILWVQDAGCEKSRQSSRHGIGWRITGPALARLHEASGHDAVERCSRRKPCDRCSNHRMIFPLGKFIWELNSFTVVDFLPSK